MIKANQLYDFYKFFGYQFFQPDWSSRLVKHWNYTAIYEETIDTAEYPYFYLTVKIKSSELKNCWFSERYIEYFFNDFRAVRNQQGNIRFELKMDYPEYIVSEYLRLELKKCGFGPF